VKPTRREQYFRVQRHLLRLQSRGLGGGQVDWWYHGAWTPVLAIATWDPTDVRLSQWLAAEAGEVTLHVGDALEYQGPLPVEPPTTSAKREEKK